MKSFSAPLVVLLAVTSACGSRTTTRHATSRGDTNAGPADIPAMRALLEQYSPVSYDMVTTYEALPTVYVLGNTTTTLSHSGGFADYFDDGAPQNLVDYMSTSVHEVYHAYASVMAYQLMQDGQVARGLGAQAALIDEAPMLVTYTATYPASDMDATFPADARTSRYETYVSPSRPTQSTQQDGVYGLLEELTAYYHGSRVKVDFWPWVRDAARSSPTSADHGHGLTSLVATLAHAGSGIRRGGADRDVELAHAEVNRRAQPRGFQSAGEETPGQTRR